MTIAHLNTKLHGQIETIDQLDSRDFKDYKAFRAEKKRLLGEYALAGGHGAPYWSSRSTKAYKGA
jgi:hypothetical protein